VTILVAPLAVPAERMRPACVEAIERSLARLDGAESGVAARVAAMSDVQLWRLANGLQEAAAVLSPPEREG
jgi:hypothetical protein